MLFKQNFESARYDDRSTKIVFERIERFKENCSVAMSESIAKNENVISRKECT